MGKLSDCETSLGDCSQYVRDLLERSRQEVPDAPDAPGILYGSFNSRLTTLKDSFLFPQWSLSQPASRAGGPEGSTGSMEALESPAGQALSLTSGSRGYATARLKWNQLVRDLRTAAEHIWKDEFAQDSTDEDSRKRLAGRGPAASNRQLRLEWLTSYARAFLLQLVEARLYEKRMETNFRFYILRTAHAAEGMESDRKENIIANVEEIIDEREGQIRAWDHALARVTGRRLFVAQPGDAGRLKSLSREFGEERAKPEELGWAAEADPVSDEIRFRYFDALLAEQWRHATKWGRAVWLLTLKVIIGYGIKPWRFVVTTLAVIGSFGALYLVNDLLAGNGNNPYPVNFASWADAVRTVRDHIALSLSSILSRGPDPRPVGPFAQGLLLSESLIGYFLFAVLAALLVEQLTESER